MIVENVILAANNNKTYSECWNIVAPVWKDIYNINPVLVFLGTKEEYRDHNFANIGDHIIIPRVQNISRVGHDWTVTWGLFWGASQFKDSICMLCGIDQIPLSDTIFSFYNNINDNNYVVSFADAYEGYTENTLGYYNTQTGVLYPSSHHIGKGSLYKKIFEIEDNWEQEIIKLNNLQSRYYFNHASNLSPAWGLDECYSSEKLSTYSNQSEITYLNLFKTYFNPKRIFDYNIHSIDVNLLIGKQYCELTTRHINNAYITKIIKYLQLQKNTL